VRCRRNKQLSSLSYTTNIQWTIGKRVVVVVVDQFTWTHTF